MNSKIILCLFLAALYACDSDNSTKPVSEQQDDSLSSSVENNLPLSSSEVGSYSSPDNDIASSSSFLSSSSEIEILSSSSSKVYTNYDPITGVLTDERDGETYKTAKIGNQIWMGENLRYLGDDTLGCYHWDDDISDSIAKKYGRHYSWMIATQLPCDNANIFSFSGENPIIKEPHQGVCPDGWHVPSHREWQELFNTAPLESLLSTEWKALRNGYNGTDDYGFSLQLGRDEVEDYQEFILLEEYQKNISYSLAVYHSENGVNMEKGKKWITDAYLRCLKD